MGNFSEFARAVQWVISHVSFNQDVVVSVFETNIRLVGGNSHTVLLFNE